LDESLPLRERIGAAYAARQRKFDAAKRFVEIVLVIIGGAVASGASWLQTGFSWPPTSPQIVAFVGLLVSVAGALFIVLVRQDEDHLFDASQALQAMEQNEGRLEEAEEVSFLLQSSSRQLRSLYLAFNAARGMLERAICKGHQDEDKLVADVLVAMRLELRIALDFQIDNTWTIVVFKSMLDNSDGYRYLHCIAHDRSIECDISKARRWREGIGVGGIALARNDEVVAPDILESSAVSLFSLNGDAVREEDRKRYRSMFAVPVQVGSDTLPWGVVLASCNEPGHFPSSDVDMEDSSLNNKEGLRALAGMVALAVAACRHARVSPEDASEEVVEEQK
jgi:hypothetical protein